MIPNVLLPLQEQLENAYRDKGPEAVAEGIGYYVLLRSIEVFDRDEAHIAPLLARCNRAALRFFDERVGSVEVSYKRETHSSRARAAVERVIFPLPYSCRPGKLLADISHWEQLLYTREWTNRDQKDVEFVRYLLQVTSRE